MRYRLGILGGLVIMGIVALGLATGITDSGTVEAAKPSVTVTWSAPTALQGSCVFNIQVTWEGNAFDHKNGYYWLFLRSQQGDGPFKGEGDPVNGKVDKRTAWGVVQGLTFTGTPDTNYYSWIVFFTSKGKDGSVQGRQLFRDDLNFSCDAQG